MNIPFHLSVPPTPRAAKHPASTRRLIWWVSASYCLAVKAILHTTPAHVPHLLSLSEIPEARRSWSAWHTPPPHQVLLWPTGSKKSPITELCLETSGEESPHKSLLLTGTPPAHILSSQGLVTWPSASAPCHITGHKVALSLWKCLWNAQWDSVLILKDTALRYSNIQWQQRQIYLLPSLLT